MSHMKNQYPTFSMVAVRGADLIQRHKAGLVTHHTVGIRTTHAQRANLIRNPLVWLAKSCNQVNCFTYRGGIPTISQPRWWSLQVQCWVHIMIPCAVFALLEVSVPRTFFEKGASFAILSGRYLNVFQHIEAEIKCPPFGSRHFQMHFLEWKRMNFDYNFAEVCS